MTFRVWILDRNGTELTCKSINNVKGYDISCHVVNPKFIEEKLNEELDTALITLEDYPQAKCFEPKTKIVIERWDSNGNLMQPFFHMIVTNDNVEAYEGLPGYYTHRVEMTEASAIAQGYHVDNIAVTYELQDVDLNYDLNLDVDSTALNSFQNANAEKTQNSSPAESPYWTREIRDSWSYANGFGATKSYTPPGWWETQGHYEYNNVENFNYGPILGVRSYKYEVEGTYGDIKNNIVYEVGSDASITLVIPKIRCYQAIENNATYTDEKYTPSNAPESVRNKGYHNENAYGTWKILTYCETQTTITVKDAMTNAVLKTIYHTYKPYSSSTVSIEYYGKPVEKYESFNTNANIVELYWDKAKKYMRLCNMGAESGATYQLKLEGNRVYDIVTELNVEDGQGVINSKTKAFTRREIPITGVNRYAWFDTEGVVYGHPKSWISFQTTPELILENTPILRTPQKYNLLNAVKKAVLATGAHYKVPGVPVLETPTAFLINPHAVERLNITNINETIFYEKNLWEVCSAIGYYIHAIPYIEFENNEQFRISFKELGKNKITPVENKRITIFNSKDIEEYFGGFDSYVKNLYSPENIIDEYIPFKPESGEYLISNDTACALTSKRILQVKEFYIVDSSGTEVDALSFIVEKSIYDTFSLNYDRVPSKANAIYYTLNTNSIQGMNTSISTKSDQEGVMPYPIKAVIGKLFKIANIKNIKVNDYYMHIVYNTSDSARLKQVRPDLNAMLLNSTFDKFPVHEQFYGQNDRIIDSERYGNLLYGELLKMGNGYYQTTEWNEVGAVKEVGDMMLIDKVPYYISQVESEWYDNIVLQKIVYHKDFNAISKIISIPCEPRFYEVANTSIIDRSPHSFENLTITTDPSGMLPERLKLNPKYISKDKFIRLIKGWLFGVDPSYPDYAVTTFRDDPDTPHGAMDATKMFVDTPKIEESGQQILVDKVVTQNKILIYSSQNSLLFKWGMEDNYSAGSFVDTRISGGNGTTDDAYFGLNYLRYCDLYGRADLMDFSLVNNDAYDFQSVRKLPQRVCSNEAVANAAISDYGRILNKDNREALRDISFQINLITDQPIFFGRAVWRKKKKPVKILLLDKAISKFSFQNLYTDKQAKVIGEIEPTYNNEQTPDGFAYVEVGVDISDALVDSVGCIAIVDSGENDIDKGGMPYIYKNVEGLPAEQKRYSFYVASANN